MSNKVNGNYRIRLTDTNAFADDEPKTSALLVESVIPKSKYEFKCPTCKEMFLTIYNHQKFCDPCREKPKVSTRKGAGPKRTKSEISKRNLARRRARETLERENTIWQRGWLTMKL